MSRDIYVINPTRTEAISTGIERAIEPLRIPGGPPIRCVLLKDAPHGIESQRDVEFVSPLICAKIKELDAHAAAFVIACFSDPGLYAARETTAAPVYGIAECGLLTAMTVGQRVGVISILETSVPRHWRMYGALGIASRIAADLPIGLGVVELEDGERAFNRLVQVGSTLRQDYQCQVIVLGCAGMARYQSALAEAVGIHVIDPTSAAVAFALGQTLLRTPIVAAPSGTSAAA